MSMFVIQAMALNVECLDEQEHRMLVFGSHLGAPRAPHDALELERVQF